MTNKSHKAPSASDHETEHHVGPQGKIRPIAIAMGLLLCATALTVGCQAANGDNRQTTDGEALMRAADGDDAAESRATSEEWRTCNVNRTGAGWGNIYLRLTCNGVSERWFIARSDQKKEMLATALTAITTGKQVQAYLLHKPSGYHEVRACYVLN